MARGTQDNCAQPAGDGSACCRGSARGSGRRRHALLAALTAALALLAHGGAQANPLVEQALAAGELDLQTALLYQVYSVRQPELLPPRFSEGAPPRCATPLLQEVLATVRASRAPLSEPLRRALARPERAVSVLSPAGRCRVHFDRTGPHAVAPDDADGNAVPDYVDAVAALADSLWELEVVELGYRAPLGDGRAGGGADLDIYLSSLGGGRYYGLTWPDAFGAGGTTAACYLELDNDYDDAIYHAEHQTPGLDGLRVTLAHEFFHSVQYGYYWGGDAVWWQEATATWMEEVAFPDINNYLLYVPDFLGAPETGLDRADPALGHAYGAALFPLYLGQRFEPAVVRQSWEEIARQERWSLEVLDRVVPGGLASAFAEFVVWNYFTGSRYRVAYTYADGALYAGLRVRELGTPARMVVADSGVVDHLACHYVALRPQLLPGGVTLSVRTSAGRWSRRALLVAPDRVESVPLGDQLRLRGWDAWEEVVVVLAVTELSATGYTYDVSAQYDPELTNDATPAALRLEPAYPNPFCPERQTQAILPFSLARPSQVTQLSIFAADGQLVRLLELGPRAARAYASDAWDGRNEAGCLVGAGVYRCVLEADGQRALRALAVVRR